MDYCETNHGSRVRVLLTEEELQLTAIDDLCNKYIDWLRHSKETTGGRKTRSANRRADTIYDEIMSFKLPPIKIKSLMSPIKTIPSNQVKMNSVESSCVDSDSDSSSGPITRSLRPRCRTPTIQNKQKSSRQLTSPCTPTNQNLRSHLKRSANGSNSSNGSSNSNVLSAALNQQHPLVSCTKIRQLLNGNSSQKRREEEKERQERQERMRLDRKAKEDRAEAQKKKLLEERAKSAKLKREERLLHAAEVRKAREEAKLQQKLLEEQAKKAHAQVISQPQHPTQLQSQRQNSGANPVLCVPIQIEPIQKQNHNDAESPKQNSKKDEPSKKNAKNLEPIYKVNKLDETFKKPAHDHNNIDISVHDETTDDCKTKGSVVALWAQAPHLRHALVSQFSKPEEELLKEASDIFMGVALPVDLDKIFGPSKAVNNRYLCRTSSAVWSPPNKPLKRTSSMVLTPTNQKR